MRCLPVFSLLLASPAMADDTPGSQTWFQLEYETLTESEGGGSSSSNGKQALVETVIANTPRGLVLEYNQLRDATGRRRSGFWYFPARVVEQADGTMVLFDESAVQRRINSWLEERNIPQELCGSWTNGGGFPFQYDCDPQSALTQIEPFDLRLEGVVAGGTFEHSLGQEPGLLSYAEGTTDTLVTSIAIDQDKAREDRVKSALIVAEMMREDLTRAQAVEQAARVQFSGTIELEFTLGVEGSIDKKVETQRLVIIDPSVGKETRYATATVERRDVAELSR